MDQRKKNGRLAGAILEMALRLPGAAGALRRWLLRHGGVLLRDVYWAPLAARSAGDDRPLTADAVFGRGKEAVERLLAKDDFALLRELVHDVGADGLRALVSKGHPLAAEASRPIPPEIKHELADILLHAGAAPSKEAFKDNPHALEHALATPRAEAMLALQQKWTSLAGIVPTGDPEVDARYREGLRTIQSPAHVRGRVLDAITEADMAHLASGTLQFPCRHSLWTQIHEILLNEDYYFECDSDAPVVIDGGAHMGMAVYYFKARYPGARITAFEPVPALRALLESNVARNAYPDVTVLPCALSPARSEAAFHLSAEWSMAGSLHDHRKALGEATDTIVVPCVPLSDYLDAPVDFLKLDIEGAEDEVLEEAAPKLGNVRHIFCEYHDGPGFPPGRLGKILGILDAADFDVQVGKSHNYQDTSRLRPFTHFNGNASQLVWARRRH